MSRLSSKIKSNRVVIYVAAGIWIIAFNIYLYFYHSQTISDTIVSIIDNTTQQQVNDNDETSTYDSFDKFDNQDDKGYKPLNTSILDSSPLRLYTQQYLDDKRNIEPIFSSNYETMFNKIEQEDEFYGLLSNLNFNDRCQLYFENLFQKNQNWFINPNERFPGYANKFDYESWIHDHDRELRIQFNKDNDRDKFDKIEDQVVFKTFVDEKYHEYADPIYEQEQKMVDYLSHLRIFNKCYLSSNFISQQNTIKTFITEQKHFAKSMISLEQQESNHNNINEKEKRSIELDVTKDCSNLEARLYPWLSNHFPVFEKWTGETILHPPTFQNSNAQKSHPSSTTSYGSCFLNKFKKSLSGKGIVLTIGDQHVDDTVHLIALLRALQNTLPIQIVYYDNLSGHSKSRIVRAAREVMKVLPESFKEVSDKFPIMYDRGLPEQEVYFVNTYSVVHENYKSKFDGYGNKFLATLFNSFEEFILIDADTVLLKNPEWFFNHDKFIKSGTFFFRDRTAVHTRPETDTRFLKKMSPSTLDAIMFDIPLITSHSMDLPGMNGLFHEMESGVVVIDKTRHFNSILLLPQLNFMDAFTEKSHGDKELFWFSFIINGDEQFMFNGYAAGALGRISDPRVVNGDRIRKAQQLCSAHPGHVDDESDELIWFNSGFHFCSKYKDIDYRHDLHEQDGRYKPGITTIEEMKTYYFDPIDIEAVIIPPFENSGHMRLDNSEGEPHEGWELSHGLCSSYLWCAYSSIGGKDNRQLGTVITIDEESKKLFRYYGDVWVGNY
ncbi:mannosyltransferase [Scheffersomyces coipomensis]|uniref:mannosyltransferase n=1 Tax=Scheffersomyces coipomensis TaxID=1788519 RepID=UPI00315D949B